MTPRLLLRERAQERDVPVGKDLEKGVVKRDDMKLIRELWMVWRSRKQKIHPNVSQQERREIVF